MKQFVYLIGVSQGKIAEITTLLKDRWQVKRVTRAGLMTAVQQHKPSAIVIIESDLDLDSLTAIDSTISLEYIPTICVSFNRHPMALERSIHQAIYIQSEGLGVVLPALLEQACTFATQYNELHVCYDTYEIMNEEVGNALEIYIDPRLDYSEMGMTQYFDMVYKNNMFLDKVPSKLWLLKSLGDSLYNANLYDLATASLLKQFDFYDDIFCFQTYAKTGFIKNAGIGELSDISDITELLPVEVLRQSTHINNAACFSNNRVMLIAMDYNGKILQSDLKILKALTIKSDLMVNIKTQMRALEESLICKMNALATAAEGKDDVTVDHTPSTVKESLTNQTT